MIMASELAQPSVACCGWAGAAARVRSGARAILGGTAVWALADQAVISLGNFLTNIILARHLAPSVYGVWWWVFNVILFLNSLHASLVCYPLTLKAATEDEAYLAGRARRSMSLTLFMTPLMAAGLVSVSAATGRWSVLPFALVALLTWQLQETLRRSMMARLRHRDALPGDFVSYWGQMAAVYVLARTGRLAPETAFIAVAATSALAAVLQAMQLGIGSTAWRHGTVREAAAESWRLGRWVLLTALVSAGVIHLIPWSLGAAHGTTEVARFAAVATIMNASNPVVMSIGSLIVPVVAAAVVKGGPGPGGARAARRAALKYAAAGAALLAPFYVMLLLLPGLALRLFYGPDSHYLSLGHELRVFVLCYAMMYVGNVSVSILNGLGRGRAGFIATTLAAAGAAAVSVPLAAAFGVRGAAWGGVVPISIQLLVAATLLRNALKPGPSPKREMVTPAEPVAVVQGA
jgi:O-antigen/teichoic acid export membrane protein